jgi:hypothetical protein
MRRPAVTAVTAALLVTLAAAVPAPVRASFDASPDHVISVPEAAHGSTASAPRFGWSVSAYRSMVGVGAPNFAPSGWGLEPKKGAAFSLGWDGGEWEVLTRGDYSGPPATQTGRSVAIHDRGMLYAGKERPTGLFGTSLAVGQVGTWYSNGSIASLTCGGTYEEFGAASTMYGAAVAVSNPYGTGCVALKESYSSGSPSVLLGTDVAPTDASLAFGQSLAMTEGWLFVGAPGAGDGAAANSGAVYALPFPLQFDESSNVIFQKIEPVSSATNLQFGAAIAASSNRLVVSSPGGDASGEGVAERAAICLYELNALNDTWELADCTQGSDANASGSSYGTSVSISENGQRILVGAPDRTSTEVLNDLGNPIMFAGGAYQYSVTGSSIGSEQVLLLSAPEPFDSAGYSVAITNEIAVVGVPGDKGGTGGSTANWGTVAVWGTPATAAPVPTTTTRSASLDEALSGSVAAGAGAVFTFQSSTPGWNNDYSAQCMTMSFDAAGAWSATATVEGTCSYAYEVRDSAGWAGGTIEITTASSRPSYSIAPGLTGYIGVGQRITGSQGTWSGAASYSYQWYRCTSAALSETSLTDSTAPSGCSAISGATAISYVSTTTDIGKYLRLQVRARKTVGSDTNARWVYTASTAAVGRPPAVSTSAPPKIVGSTATRGKRLTAGKGTWSYTTGATYEYQWLRCTKRGTSTATARPSDCTAISGAIALTYTPVTADRAKYLRFMVTVTTPQGRATRVSITVGSVR